MRGSDPNRRVFDLQEQHGDFFRSSSRARPAQRTMGGRFMRIGNLARNAVIAALLFAPATALAADVNVSGLIHFDYYSSDDNNNYTADNTFIWRRARLAASGDIVKDFVGYHAMLSMDPTGAYKQDATTKVVTPSADDAKLIQ